MSECKHERIRVFYNAETGETVSLWACTECDYRFVPIAEAESLRAENERLRAERTALSNEVLDIVNSRPTSLNDDLYDWAYDAEEKLRRLIEENKGGER